MKKKIKFKGNVANVKKNPYSKVHLKTETVNLKQTIDDVSLELTNMGQSVTHETIR